MDEIIIFSSKFLYLAIVSISLLFLVCQKKEIRWQIILIAFLALPLTYLLAKLSSLFYYNPRPFVVGQFTPLLPHAPDNGFPSDHTLFSAALAAVVYAFHRKLGSFLFVIALCVGMARVFAGVHHFIDIMGSIVIAAFTTYIVKKYVFPFLQKTNWYKKVTFSKSTEV